MEIEDKDTKALMIRLILFKDETLTEDETILATMGSLKYPTLIEEFIGDINSRIIKNETYKGSPQSHRFILGENYKEYLIRPKEKIWDSFVLTDNPFDGHNDLGYVKYSSSFNALYFHIIELKRYLTSEEIMRLISENPATALTWLICDNVNRHKGELNNDLLDIVCQCPHASFVLLNQIFMVHDPYWWCVAGYGDDPLPLPLSPYKYSEVGRIDEVVGISDYCVKLLNTLENHYELCKQDSQFTKIMDLKDCYSILYQNMMFFALKFPEDEVNLPYKKFMHEIYEYLQHATRRGEAPLLRKKLDSILTRLGVSKKKINWLEI